MNATQQQLTRHLIQQQRKELVKILSSTLNDIKNNRMDTLRNSLQSAESLACSLRELNACLQ